MKTPDVLREAARRLSEYGNHYTCLIVKSVVGPTPDIYTSVRQCKEYKNVFFDTFEEFTEPLLVNGLL